MYLDLLHRELNGSSCTLEDSRGDTEFRAHQGRAEYIEVILAYLFELWISDLTRALEQGVLLGKRWPQLRGCFWLQKQCGRIYFNFRLSLYLAKVTASRSNSPAERGRAVRQLSAWQPVLGSLLLAKSSVGVPWRFFTKSNKTSDLGAYCVIFRWHKFCMTNIIGYFLS